MGFSPPLRRCHLKEKQDGRNGRNRIKPADEETEARIDAPARSAEALGPWVFKSKYKEDRVRLKAAEIVMEPNGSKRTVPAVVAEFSRNTWTTEDPELAALLRKKIESREPRNPLGVVETTII